MLLTKKLLLAVVGLCCLGVSAQSGAQTVFDSARREQQNEQTEARMTALELLDRSLATTAAVGVRNRTALGFLKFEDMIAAAIDDRLGAAYRWGGTGPSDFDCSGFVWSTFRSAGIDFERLSARSLWQRFMPASPDEEFKFGTLVFFSRLAHVGIVADEHGFYHASRHHGVVYSPFNDYWLSRLDGFRRVPLPPAITAD
jgi:cell wall-associated NlpC family hydrolase